MADYLSYSMMPAADSINSTNVFAVEEEISQAPKSKEEAPKSPGSFLNGLGGEAQQPAPQAAPATSLPFAPVGSPSFSLPTMQQNPQAAQNMIALVKERMNNIKPWKDFFSLDQFHLPQSTTAAQSRVSHNVNHFQNNYLMFVLLLTAFSLLSNFSLLFVAAIIGAGFVYLQSLNPESSFNVGGQVISVRSLNYAWMAICVLLLYLTSAISTVFWIGSVAAVGVTAHAAMHDIPIESEFNTV